MPVCQGSHEAAAGDAVTAHCRPVIGAKDGCVNLLEDA